MTKVFPGLAASGREVYTALVVGHQLTTSIAFSEVSRESFSIGGPTDELHLFNKCNETGFG